MPIAPQVREETEADRPAIRRLLIDAFGQPAEAALVGALRADGDLVCSLVAEEAGMIVGHVAVSRLTSDLPAAAIAPLAVAADRRRRGIASALVRAAVTRSEAAGYPHLFVVGDPALWRRFGFSPEAARGVASPYAGPYFMLYSPHGAAPYRGRVDYPQAFAREL